MKETARSTAKSGVQVCKPLSPAHRRGVRWFSAITHAIESNTDKDLDRSLQHSIQFYSCYAESGDSRYLALCEDFLKYAVKALDR
ncbi:MAG: hypothetical protein AAFX94_11790 [Myxococcota bacterium]